MSARASNGGHDGRSFYKERAPGSLKEAVAELVTACGGQGPSAHLCRVSRSHIARYTDDSGENDCFHMPVDIVVRLETHCGDAIVTRWLAQNAGALFVALPKGAPQPYLKQLGQIGQKIGRFFEQAHTALMDGVMTPHEAGQVKREAMRIATALGVLIGQLNGVIASGRGAP